MKNDSMSYIPISYYWQEIFYLKRFNQPKKRWKIWIWLCVRLLELSETKKWYWRSKEYPDIGLRMSNGKRNLKMLAVQHEKKQDLNSFGHQDDYKNCNNL